jgi:L-ascorbate metabolism protein UlaG (beta-lactamase superfamily)
VAHRGEKCGPIPIEGDLIVHPVRHATFLVLITHSHGDHFDPTTLADRLPLPLPKQQ